MYNQHSCKPVIVTGCTTQLAGLYRTDLVSGAIGETQSVGQRLLLSEHLVWAGNAESEEELFKIEQLG